LELGTGHKLQQRRSARYTRSLLAAVSMQVASNNTHKRKIDSEYEGPDDEITSGYVFIFYFFFDLGKGSLA
jgi:hypothetical protein